MNDSKYMSYTLDFTEEVMKEWTDQGNYYDRKRSMLAPSVLF